MMMCTPYMSRELQVFKIIIIYVFFIEFIDNKKLEKNDVMMCISCMSNYYLCDFYINYR
jgi:hypothetical protein